MTSNTSERRIQRAMLDAMMGRGAVASRGGTGAAGGWVMGLPEHYDRDLGLDPDPLLAFLEKTQRTTDAERAVLDLGEGTPSRQSFLEQLRDEVSARGVIDVLRRGVLVGGTQVDLFYGMRSSEDPPSPRRYSQNRFSLIPDLRFSADESQPLLDLCLFINGLPVATFMLKDGRTRQSADDAATQYRRLPSGEELLLQPGRCLAHFAVDETRVLVCSELRGEASVFHTFNLSTGDRDENPRSLFGIATDYLWRRILTRPGMIDLIENYAQMMDVEDESSGGTRPAPIFPRHHQLEVVQQIVPLVQEQGPGQRYLVEHEQGSGTSFTIAWLVRQLGGLQQAGIRIYDAFFIVSDRPEVELRLKSVIRNLASVSTHLEEDSALPAQIHDVIERGVNVIFSQVAYLPLILDEIEKRQPGRRFALVIDENPPDRSTELTAEDEVNRAVAGRAPLSNTSFYVFAPSANETALQLFGEPFNDHGETRYRPFHLHTS